VQIDPFTLIAQIINFLILVLLLRRFLYGPIIRTMDERERRIAAELDEAARKEDEAQREARECHAEKVRLEDSRGEMLTRAQEEAAALKKKMVAEARSEIEENKTKWTRAIEIEKETFLQNLRQRTGEEVYAISRQVITDLANIELERHIIDTFIERLRGLEDSERLEIATAARRTREGAVITTSFPIGSPAISRSASTRPPIPFAVSSCGLRGKRPRGVWRPTWKPSMRSSASPSAGYVRRSDPMDLIP
jgi:F-type H+-transporting ATPase subunit b